jgi:hypothetical protein
MMLFHKSSTRAEKPSAGGCGDRFSGATLAEALIFGQFSIVILARKKTIGLAIKFTNVIPFQPGFRVLP